MDSLFDILLGKSLSGGSGGGGGGTSNYNALENKPQINGTTLTGNKSLSDLGIAAASDIPTVNNGTLTIQKNGTLVNTFKANQASDVTVNITVPTSAADVSALPSSTKYAAALSLTINSSTYVVTGQLKDQDGNNIGTAQTIDLPLETMVVGGSYDDEHKKIVLTLKNGNTVDIPVADLVSGLQTELSATNKLNPAYINYDSTHAAVTDAEKTTWSGKQDALTFDGTYSASTNKAATVSTVTNAINALDVTGASGISAAKTISAWSETNGKVSVSTQDIAIAGTQAVLTGYQKSTTAGQAVAATDNVNQAIGKVEKRVSDNENNILLSESLNPISVYSLDSKALTGASFIIPEDTAVKMPKGEYNLSFTSNSAISGTFVVNNGSTETHRASLTIANGSNSFNFTINSNSDKIRFYASASCEITNLSIVPKIYRDNGYTDYVSQTLPNTELTTLEQQNEANILSVFEANGTKNILPNKGTLSKNDITYTWVNGNVSVSGTKTTGANYVGVIPLTSLTDLGLSDKVVISNNGTNCYLSIIFWSASESYTSSYDVISGSNIIDIPTGYTHLLARLGTKSASTGTINETIQPMICTKAAWDVSHTYQPYAMSNVDLTTATKQNEANILFVAENGATNYVPVATDSYNLHGITATTSNGEITISGTSDYTFSLYIVGKFADDLLGMNKITSKLPDVIAFTGAPNTDNKNRLIFTLYNGSTWVYSGSTNDLYHDLTGKTYTHWFVYLPIVSGNSYNGVWKPMIVPKSLYDSGLTQYQPYAMSNADLTAAEKQNEANILSLSAYIVPEMPSGNLTDSNVERDYNCRIVGYAMNTDLAGRGGWVYVDTIILNVEGSRRMQKSYFSDGVTKTRFYGANGWESWA